LVSAFTLYLIRVILRDLVQPISEIPQFFEAFDKSYAFNLIMMVQAYLFDFCDFIVALITISLFYKSAQTKKKALIIEKGREMFIQDTNCNE
jgi:hypothetical protein